MSPPDRHARLKELFFAALDAEGGARRRIVAAAAREDPLLGREVEQMLRLHDRTTEELFSALGERAAELLAPAPSRAQEVAGRQLGAWRIVRLLAEGGMGRVYLAERADAAYRELAAVKLSRAAFPSDTALERFRRERQALADLRHPAIATLLDGGETDEGQPYLVLEYVEGVPIDEACARRGLGLRERIELFLEVCAAVSHAHRRLIVHRDLKPSNVLVDAEGRPKLLDFGIAKLLDEEPRESLTGTLERVLTPETAAPEQLLGEPVTTATDVYALGGLLYRLLAEAAPHEAADRSAAAAIERAASGAPAERASSAARRRGAGERRARELAGDLDNILATALRREPERRYASVDALADDLRRFLADRPVTARPDTIRYRASKFLRRHRLSAAAAAMVVLALVAGAGVALWQGREAARERDRARAAARRAEQVNSLLAAVLTRADPVRGGGRAATVAELLDDASERLGAELTAEPAIEADLRETLGETYLNLGLAAEAERSLRRALELRLATGAPAAHARVQLASALRANGRLAEAEAELRRALAESPPTRARERVAALDGLLVTLRQLGRGEEAAVAGREALALLERLPDERSLLAAVLNNLALVHGERGDFAAAEPLHRRAVEVIRAERGERHPQTAEAIANLAGVLDLQGRYDEAEPLYRGALEIQESALGDRHPDFVRTTTSYANLLWLMARPAEAEPIARRAVELATAAFGPEHLLTAYAENILGGALLDLARFGDAERHIRSALEQRRRLLPTGHWLIASAQSNLGAALAGLGRRAEAERELLAARAALVASVGAGHEKSKLTEARLAALRASDRR